MATRIIKSIHGNTDQRSSKAKSTGQSIVHAIKPRSSPPPIPFGLAVEIDHVFGSKWLQNELSSLGYSCSSDEVTWYKQCVVSNENINDFLKFVLQGIKMCCFGHTA